MKHIEVALIAVDASTQTRASISEAVVADYAERMLNGAQFPPIVLFHDGNQYYVGDGFHRVLASQRNGAETVPSDVKPGTREDALWFALGANREHGHQMTPADKKHAALLAIDTWKDMSTTRISEQIGVSQEYVSRLRRQVSTSSNLPDTVTGKDGKTYPARRRHEVDVHTTSFARSVGAVLVGALECEVQQSGHPEREVRPPSNGMMFARIAVMKLEEIRADDSERAAAFAYVKDWIDARQA